RFRRGAGALENLAMADNRLANAAARCCENGPRRRLKCVYVRLLGRRRVVRRGRARGIQACDAAYNAISSVAASPKGTLVRARSTDNADNVKFWYSLRGRARVSRGLTC